MMRLSKKVFLDNKVIPQLMQFGLATFKPDQFVETHKHDTIPCMKCFIFKEVR